MHEPGVVALMLAAVVLWGVVSDRLEQSDVTAPIVFVAVGVAFDALGILDLAGRVELAGIIRTLAEVALVLVLFCDAARVRFATLRDDAARYARLLGVGLPLAGLFGVGLAALLFPGLDVWLLVLVGAALAPTDATLGVPVVTNPAVPSRIRRALNVESGLNDGIATPVVFAAIAGAAAAEHVAGATGVGAAVAAIAFGLLAGLVVGGGGGALVRAARRRGWIDRSFGGPTVLALALLAYVAALAVDGNGFVAAFVGGLAFRNACGRHGEREVDYAEQSAAAVSLIVWLLFGAVVVPVILDRLTWQVAVYAVLSLTAVRMVAVAVALMGSGTPRSTVAFIGWFGPRGLASVIFALLAVEDLGPDAAVPVAVIGLTELLSVVAHGATALPLAARYGATVGAAREREPAAGPAVPVRHLAVRRRMHSPRGD